MAESILILAVLVFAVRGMFLGFVGVISRVVGIFLAYYVTYRQQEKVTEYVVKNTQFDIAPVVLQMGTGLCLFFGTVMVAGLVISLIARLLSKISPSVKVLLDNQSTGGRILGATTNGLVGVAIVLAGIWAYDIVAKKPTNDSQLHSVAKSFGDTIFAMVDTNTLFSGKHLEQTSSEPFSSESKSTSTHSGSAYIISEENPNKKFSIETDKDMEKTQSQSPSKQTEKSPLFSSDKIQNLLNNSRLRSIVQKKMEDHPEEIEKILDNPLVKEMLEMSTNND
ncbi:MAG: putative membrane protein required for colicin V production [Oceanicoccus sp.]|jgi:uncharacterized membrane protein required for colicin V production